jgi:predicted enzyme related to lactoylglutathione lyase
MTTMTANLTHFALNADDVEATRAFYERALGWTFRPWGPPGFYQIQTGPDDDPGVKGALQARRDLVEGTPTVGVEPTFEVADLTATVEAVEHAGGRLLMDRFTIEGVGHLCFVQDPAGNAVGLMEYIDGA